MRQKITYKRVVGARASVYGWFNRERDDASTYPSAARVD